MLKYGKLLQGLDFKNDGPRINICYDLEMCLSLYELVYGKHIYEDDT